MAKLPMYTQRYQQGTRRASAEDFGAATGRAQEQAGRSQQNFGNTMMQASEQFAQIEVRRRNREDTINRVRAINEYRQLAEQEATRTSTEDDLTSTDVPKNYGAFLNEELGRIVSEHGGSSASKAELETQLLNIQGAYSRDMYKQSTAAQFKAMDTHLSTVIRQASDAVGDAPSTLNEYFVQIDAEIEMMSAALTPEQEVAYKETARAQLIASAASTELARGNYEAVEAMLADPIAESTLDPDTMRQLKTKLIVGSRQEQLEAAAFQSKVNAIEQVAGPLTKAQKLQLAGISSTSGGSQTTAQKISEFETVMGRPATAQEIQKFYNVESSTAKSSGGTYRERLLTTVDYPSSTSFSQGLMTPAEEAEYMTAVGELTLPQRTVDSLGNVTYTTPTLPTHVKNALAARGIAIPQEGGAPIPEEDAGPDDVGYTWWGEAGNIAGPGPTVGATLQQGLPVDVGIDPIYAQRRQTLKSEVNTLVGLLQQNPRYAEGERNMIKQEMNLEGGLMDNPTAFKTRLLAVDDALALRLKDATDIIMADPSTTTKEMRQWASSVVARVPAFRARLGIPPRIKSKQEHDQLPVGTEYIAPNGAFLIKRPKEQSANGGE